MTSTYGLSLTVDDDITTTNELSLDIDLGDSRPVPIYVI
jgi:hypothetical protein